MALARRASQRMTASIWPGFVDAMTALLLVLMFVLTIFMIVQFVLQEQITGQETELEQLASEVNVLARALGLEQQTNSQLEDDLAAASQRERNQQTMIANLSNQLSQQAAELDDRNARIASFEEQVATLLSQRDDARARGEALAANVEELEAAQSRLISEQEAMQLALARARDEVDAQTEAARLAAAQREALEAMTADLQRQAEESGASLAEALARLQAAEAGQEAAEAELSEAEALRLTEAAAAEALRKRLEESDAELTAMTLALEEQRKQAEETLTLLAAAQAAEKDLDDRLAAALLSLTEAETAASQASTSAQNFELELALAKLEAEEAGAEVTRLKGELAAAQEALTAAGQSGDERDARIAELAAELEQARANADSTTESLRERLAAALAAKLAAEAGQTAQMTEAERQATLLAAAQARLAEEQAISTEAQRQVAVLNAQVGELRAQLNVLQGLIDEARSRDSDAQVQIESLGTNLNAALARAAAEERRRRELEEDERKRLEAEAAQLRSQAEELEAARSEFFAAIRRVLGDREGVQIVGDRFVFSSEVLFSPGSADLSETGREQIAGVVRLLSEVASQIPAGVDWILRVDGHTDNVPIASADFADNWELSQARALSVVRYMTSELGFPPARLAATGFGEYRPVNPADTPEARAQNRRIELKLTER